MKHIEMIMVIEAHSEGKLIEYKKIASSEWLSTNHPSFDFCRQLYRVKPEPKYKTYSFGNCTECSTGESYEFVEKKALEDALSLLDETDLTAEGYILFNQLSALIK
jgi:hypothetical protein